MINQVDPSTSIDGERAVVSEGDRILFLIDEMSAITAGGTERQLLQLVAIARDAGLSPAICVLRGTEWLTPKIACCNVTHSDIRRVQSWNGMKSLYRLARSIRARNFKILVTFFSESNLLGPWIGKLAGVPVVLGTRRNLAHMVAEAPRRSLLRMQWLSNLLVDEILVNSHAVAQNTARNEWGSERKIRVVYNGIKLENLRARPGVRQHMRRSLGLSEHDLLVGNVSGLRAVKGVVLFVEAAALASQLDQRLKFVLVGEGEMRPELEASIRKHGLEHSIHLAGAAEDVTPYLAAMDIAVLCSSAEGFSNSLLEYMAAGIPTIATDVGGNREALGDSGLLIPANSSAALRDAIIALTDAELRRNFKIAAASQIQKFDIRHAQENMRAIFRRLLATMPASKHVEGAAS